MCGVCDIDCCGEHFPTKPTLWESTRRLQLPNEINELLQKRCNIAGRASSLILIPLPDLLVWPFLALIGCLRRAHDHFLSLSTGSHNWSTPLHHATMLDKVEGWESIHSLLSTFNPQTPTTSCCRLSVINCSSFIDIRLPDISDPTPRYRT